MEWIKANDRLPPPPADDPNANSYKSNPVLISYLDEYGYQNTDIASFMLAGNSKLEWRGRGLFWIRKDQSCVRCERVTHWMPLPDPPEASA